MVNIPPDSRDLVIALPASPADTGFLNTFRLKTELYEYFANWNKPVQIPSELPFYKSLKSLSSSPDPKMPAKTVRIKAWAQDAAFRGVGLPMERIGN